MRFVRARRGSDFDVCRASRLRASDFLPEVAAVLIIVRVAVIVVDQEAGNAHARREDIQDERSRWTQFITVFTRLHRQDGTSTDIKRHVLPSVPIWRNCDLALALDELATATIEPDTRRKEEVMRE